MNPDDFRRLLLLEQYSAPVREWKPPVEHLLAGVERVELLADDQEQEAAS